MSVVPHSLAEPLQLPPRVPAWRACARESAWLLLAALAATAVLALFVLLTEGPAGDSFAAHMLRPINILRLTVMTGCLALWSYILRSARRVTAR